MLKLSAEVDEVDQSVLDELTLEYLEGMIDVNKKLHTQSFQLLNENNQMLNTLVKDIKKKSIEYRNKQ